MNRKVPIIQPLVIQCAMSKYSILSTVNSACSRMIHTPPPHALYILCTQLWPLQMYCCSGAGITFP
jgi:hypothetical protein